MLSKCANCRRKKRPVRDAFFRERRDSERSDVSAFAKQMCELHTKKAPRKRRLFQKEKGFLKGGIGCSCRWHNNYNQTRNQGLRPSLVSCEKMGEFSHPHNSTGGAVCLPKYRGGAHAVFVQSYERLLSLCVKLPNNVALSVRSQGRSMSVRPKWPYAAVCRYSGRRRSKC